ncbi:hypothetical protein [Subtercola endophyticus]|nr:hypothetical protein [Subtercola endophyticus]UFS59979.1 hypothetical protein LQ955_04130 [Subtercola endophyticus]
MDDSGRAIRGHGHYFEKTTLPVGSDDEDPWFVVILLLYVSKDVWSRPA